MRTPKYFCTGVRVMNFRPNYVSISVCTCNMGNVDDSEKMDGSKARHSRVLVQAINLTLSVFNERIPLSL